MKLFKRKQNVQPESKAKVFDKAMLTQGKDVDRKTFDEIIKTTDSMKVIAATNRAMGESDGSKIEGASNSLLRSYDLAVRKISATFEEIMQTKKVVSNDFLTVQLIIKDFEKNSNIDHVVKVINVFADAVEQQLAHGRSVKLENRLIIEPADYVNKIIPLARFISDGYINVNTVSWEDIAIVLQEGSIISATDRDIIASLTEAIITNVYNGYYVKLGNFIIAKIRPESDDLMVLFSADTIAKINNIHSNDRLEKRSKVVNKSNYISSFKESVDQTKAQDVELARELISAEFKAKVNAKATIEEIKQREQEYASKVEQEILAREEQANKVKELDEEQIKSLDGVFTGKTTKSKKELKAEKLAAKTAAKAAKEVATNIEDIEMNQMETELKNSFEEENQNKEESVISEADFKEETQMENENSTKENFEEAKTTKSSKNKSKKIDVKEVEEKINDQETSWD